MPRIMLRWPPSTSHWPIRITYGLRTHCQSLSGSETMTSDYLCVDELNHESAAKRERRRFVENCCGSSGVRWFGYALRKVPQWPVMVMRGFLSLQTIYRQGMP